MKVGLTKVVVSDTSILIELLKLDLLESFFQLKFSMATSIFVIEEVTDREQTELIKRFIGENVLLVNSPDERQLALAVSLYHKNSKLSLTDCCVIELAQRIGATVLTGDQRMREESERNKIPCAGFLTIMQQLVAENLLSKEQGVQKVEMHSANNKRAPKLECLALVERWKD